jgi:hypothetical protein
MDKIKAAVSGKKTYLAIAIGGLYLLGCWAGVWQFDEKVLAGVGLSSVAFLRMGITKLAQAQETKDPQ